MIPRGIWLVVDTKIHTETGEQTHSATVTSTSWELSILVEEFREVKKSDWLDEIPDDAEVQYE